jgi:hypothetical protein
LLQVCKRSFKEWFHMLKFSYDTKSILHQSHWFLHFKHVYVIKYKNRWFCGKIHGCSSEHTWTMLATQLGSWCDDSQVSLNASKCSFDKNEADSLVHQRLLCANPSFQHIFLKAVLAVAFQKRTRLELFRSLPHI